MHSPAFKTQAFGQGSKPKIMKDINNEINYFKRNVAQMDRFTRALAEMGRPAEEILMEDERPETESEEYLLGN